MESITGELTTDEGEIDWNKEKQKAVIVKSTELTANGEKMSLETYYVENVGMVKQIAKIAGAVITLQLEKYDEPKE
jgi:hypothetical protein